MFTDALYENRRRYSFLLLSFTVMPDHVHLILLPDSLNTVSDVMRHIKGSFSRLYNERSGRSGPLWQRSFYERALRSEAALQDTIAYVDANPVEAGLTPDASKYAYGSASGRYETDLVAFLR